MLLNRPSRCVLCIGVLFSVFSEGRVVTSQNGLDPVQSSTLFASFGGNPTAVDLDADGDSDFLMLSSGAARVVWNLGGSFVIGPTLPSVPSPFELRIGDVDGDLDIDFVILSFSTFSVLRNLGTTVSRTDFAMPTGVAVNTARLIDSDGDGDLDLLFHPWTIVKNDGSGAFVAIEILGVPVPFSLAVLGVTYADFDGDGDLDRIDHIDSVSPLQPRGFVYLRNNGGVLAVAFYRTKLLPYASVTEPLVVDFDGDGDPDVVSAGGNPGLDLLVERNDGGRFTSLPPFSIITALGIPTTGLIANLATVTADVDGDGRTEVFVRSLLPMMPSATRTWIRVESDGATTSAAIFGPPLSFGIDRVLFADVVGGAASGRDMVQFADGGPGLTSLFVWPNNLLQTVLARTINVIGPARRSVRIGELGQPITFEVRDALGQPEDLVNVTLSSTESGVLIAPTTLTTDALGRVTLTPLVGPSSIAGPARIVASAPLAARASAVVDILGLRGGRSTAPNGSEVVDFEIIQESAGIPFIFAADFAPAAPIATPFGDIWTSILAPTPSLYLFDGIGIFEPPIPGLTTAPNIAITATLTVVPPPGTTFAAQAYGIDDSQPYPANLIVTNPYIFGF